MSADVPDVSLGTGNVVSVATILDLDDATLADRCSKGMVVRCDAGDKKLVKRWFRYRWVRC